MPDSSSYIKRLKNGDISAFDYLYESWSTKLYNFVLHISYQDKFHAEDIVQSVFIKIWEMRMNLDPDKNFDSLVFTIARHLLVNHHQHKMYEYLYEKQCKGLPGNDMASETNLIESELDVHLLEELIDRLVEKLPPERRRIFLLSRKQFLTNKQIAEQLHISVNTVETQMTKAISFLRNRLSKLLCFF